MLAGATSEVLLAAASILFSVCILLIPFLAKRIVEGDLGTTMFTVLGAAAALAQSAAGFASGSSEGFGKTSSGAASSDGGGSSAAAASAGSPPAGPPPAGATAGATPAAPVAGTGGNAPSGPAPGGAHGIGQHRPVNIPHAVGWLAGAAAAIGVKGGQRAIVAGRNLVTRAAGAAQRRDSES
jgi:hypothetical protein